MTGTDHDMHPADKMDSHYRQQLSALMDGALSPDEARFLLRRLQHDAELAQYLDRWQIAGDAMRGEGQAILPAGFSARVAAAISVEPTGIAAVTLGRQARAGASLRWGSGAALAASVALVALFAARQPSGPESLRPSAPSASSVASQASPSGDMIAESGAGSDMRAGDDGSAATGTPASVSVSPRNPATGRRATTRSQGQRVAIRTAARDRPPLVASSPAASLPGDAAPGGDVFSTVAASRPWPTATLQQAPAAAVFTVDYGTATAPTFYPFEPRLPDVERPGEAASPPGVSVPPP